jgi:hypothetical protein
MVTLRVEDGVKRKILQLQSCREFHGERFGHKTHLIPSTGGRDKPLHCGPRWGDGNPRDYIKGGTLARGRHLHPRICSHQSHVFASPMDLISMGEGSHEAMKEGAKGRRSPMMPAAGESPALPPAPPPPSAPLSAHLRHLHRYLHHQLLLLCSGSSSHTSLYRPM